MSYLLPNAIEYVLPPFSLQARARNPAPRTQQTTCAVEVFLSSFPGHNALTFVSRVRRHHLDPGGPAGNDDSSVHLRTQDLPYLLEETSCLNLFDREEAWDIDDEVDFRLTELLMQDRRRLETEEPRRR